MCQLKTDAPAVILPLLKRLHYTSEAPSALDNVHLDEVGTLILLNNLDVFAVSETWLNSTWNDHELNIQGYQLFRQDRETTVASKAPHGGGVAIYAKSKLHCRRMTFSN